MRTKYRSIQKNTLPAPKGPKSNPKAKMRTTPEWSVICVFDPAGDGVMIPQKSDRDVQIEGVYGILHVNRLGEWVYIIDAEPHMIPLNAEETFFYAMSNRKTHLAHYNSLVITIVDDTIQKA